MKTTLFSCFPAPILILVIAIGFMVMPQTASAETQQQADTARTNAISKRDIALVDENQVGINLTIVVNDDNWDTLATQAQGNAHLTADEKAYCITLANQCQSLWNDAQTKQIAGDTSFANGDTAIVIGDNYYSSPNYYAACMQYNSGSNCFQAANGAYYTVAYNYDLIHIKLNAPHLYVHL